MSKSKPGNITQNATKVVKRNKNTTAALYILQYCRKISNHDSLRIPTRY